MRSNDRIAELEVRVAELTAHLERLTGGGLPPAVVPADPPEERSSRRTMLKLAGAAAAGAVATVAGRTTPAAAQVGDLLGATTVASGPTRIDYLANSDPAGNTFTAFLMQVGSQPVAASTLPFGGALTGRSSTPAAPSGLVGLALTNAGFGVVGANSSVDGVGVQGVGGQNGIGVRGVGGGYAVAATRSTRANLFLQPNNDASGVSSPKTLPTARTDAHFTGELENVNGDLWLCVGSGAPGTWRKLSGPSASGAYHPLTPARVYDSRLSQPSFGPLGVPNARHLSLADRRDLGNGTVLTTNFVPAGATAISCIVTVLNTKGSGFLAINPRGTMTVNATTINWSETGQILSNGVILTVDANRSITVIAGGIAGSMTDFVLDVNGYFL
jgi:hypothetical protein